MAAMHTEAARETGGMAEAGSQTSSVPLLPEIHPDAQEWSTRASQDIVAAPDEEQTEGNTKAGKRRFWGLGKKVEDDKAKSGEQSLSATVAAPHAAPAATMRPISPLHPTDHTRATASPHPYSSSPRPHSPASSQIFERSVQDEVPPQASPHVPSHIITENHIPPVLEASSEAITDNRLNPDSVEIVTHNFHQPASVTVTGAPAASLDQSMSSSWHEDQFNNPTENLEDSASNYGTLADSTDVRRLSFISFADVVHAEHAEHPVDSAGESQHLASRDSLNAMAPHSLAPARSSSPMRSPIAPHGLGTSPPTSVSTSHRNTEASPSRLSNRGAGAGSPPISAHSPPLGGELNIETMSQALRKTGSGELSGARNQSISTVGVDDGGHISPLK